MRIAVLVTCSAILVFTLAKTANDFCCDRKSNPSYGRNLMNSVLTVLFSLIVFTILYHKRWSHRLRLPVVQVTHDIVDNPRFPAVALLQDLTATYQANLVPHPMKCFLNKFVEDAPMCHSLSRTELLSAYSCNCNDSWVPGIQTRYEDSQKKGGSHYASFRPADYIVSRGANIFMTLQVFFTFNTSNPNNRPVPSPVLWLMVYDPVLSFEKAYAQGYGPLNLFNANGPTTINLGLEYYQPSNDTGYYKYDVMFSTAGNINLVCDVTANATQLCDASLIIQIPRFDRTVQTQKMSMEWPDVILEAGAYFALVQFLSWIISGQVLATH
ncbi:hypothetical protein G7Y79_00021g050300 [Physcia stellaris]|nr:hypothetical protein G7Y79_00021g050300 [Physcia stellaris]